LKNFFRSYLDFLISAKGSKLSAVFVLILSALLIWHVQFLKVDFELEKFFPTNHPDLRFFEKHKQDFGYDNDFLSLIVESDGSVFNESFLLKAKSLNDTLQHIEGVERIGSLFNLPHLLNSPMGVVNIPLLHPSDPKKLSTDSTRIFEVPFYKSLVGSNGQSLLLHIEHRHYASKKAEDEFLGKIKSISSQSGVDVRMVGKVVAQQTFIKYIEEDFGLFLAISGILAFGLLVLLFRSVRAAIIPFLISLLTMGWVFGFMGLIGLPVNLVTSLLPPIIFFVSMSDCIHLMNAIAKAKGTSPAGKLHDAIVKVWTPTLLTSITTAIGFLSLLWINTAPIQIFGITAALGVLIAFTLTFSLAAVLLKSGTQHIQVRLQISSAWIDWIFKHQKKVVVLMIVVMVFLVPGISQIKVDAFLLGDLPASSQVRGDFEYADQNYGGSKPYELRVMTKGDRSLWDPMVLNEIKKIHQYLLDEYRLARMQSPVTVMRYLNMANHGGNTAYYHLPETQKEYDRARSLLNTIPTRWVGSVATEDKKAGRVLGFFPELGSYKTDLKNEALRDFLDNKVDHNVLDYRITGTTYLIDKSHELLSKNLLKGLLTAIFVVGLILAIYFRSWKLLLISLVPNLVPLLWVGGIIGWLGIPLKMTTAIIFTIAFGIAVDDTVHIMGYYLNRPNETADDRMKDTFSHAGSAVLLSTLISVAGFCIFMVSSFGATFYLGLFVSLSLGIALWVDITLLPVLLRRFANK